LVDFGFDFDFDFDPMMASLEARGLWPGNDSMPFTGPCKVGLRDRVLSFALVAFFFSVDLAAALRLVFFVAVSALDWTPAIVLEMVQTLLSVVVVAPSATPRSLFILTTGPQNGISIVVPELPESLASLTSSDS
jgi:hypothetical protein